MLNPENKTKKFVSQAELGYEDVILTEEEIAEWKRLMDNKLCRPTHPVNDDHIMNEDKIQTGLGPEFKEFFEVDMSSCWWDTERGCWTMTPQIKQSKETENMTTENFAFWLQGYFEINGTSNELTPMQVQIIKDHLYLVFKKETPTRLFENKADRYVEHRDGIDPKFMDMNWHPVHGYNQVVYNEHAISC